MFSRISGFFTEKSFEPRRFFLRGSLFMDYERWVPAALNSFTSGSRSVGW